MKNLINQILENGCIATYVINNETMAVIDIPAPETYSRMDDIYEIPCENESSIILKETWSCNKLDDTYIINICENVNIIISVN